MCRCIRMPGWMRCGVCVRKMGGWKVCNWKGYIWIEDKWCEVIGWEKK
jgi:hypothetical protein